MGGERSDGVYPFWWIQSFIIVVHISCGILCSFNLVAANVASDFTALSSI